MVESGVVEAEDGGVGSEGVINRSGLTERHVLASVSWLKFARTFATKKSAVELLELPVPELEAEAWPSSGAAADGIIVVVL